MEINIPREAQRDIFLVRAFLEITGPIRDLRFEVIILTTLHSFFFLLNFLRFTHFTFFNAPS